MLGIWVEYYWLKSAKRSIGDMDVANDVDLDDTLEKSLHN